MRRLAILSLFLGLFTMPALAENLQGCSKQQILVVEQAMKNAKDLTLKAASTVGDTPQYERWFGVYSDANAEEVRRTLKSVVSAIRGGGVTAQCDSVTDLGCGNATYAWVFAAEAFRMHLCPAFFQLPELRALQPGHTASDNGTREGTIVHEVSHFLQVAGTEDHCYSRSECSGMARRDPIRAIDNADSYQYFTEDVTYYARQRVDGKPPAASRDR